MISMEYDGYLLEFDTDKRLFSPSKIDTGTLATIGGYNVVMSDISDKAINLAKHNAIKNQLNEIRIIQSNGYEDILDREFSLILSNPPYHSNFSVAKEFIEEGFKRIVLGGRMIMVTKRKEWYKNKFISVFGGVTIFEVDGYYVFIAEKRNLSRTKKTGKDKGKLSKKLMRKHARITRKRQDSYNGKAL